MNIAPGRVLLLGLENADGTVTGVTSGTSQAILNPPEGIKTFYFRSEGVTSGGTILIEEADWGPVTAPYSGTWSTVQSVSASAFTGSAQLAVHVSPTIYGYVRVRISSAITGGGTVLVSARGQGLS